MKKLIQGKLYRTTHSRPYCIDRPPHFLEIPEGTCLMFLERKVSEKLSLPSRTLHKRVKYTFLDTKGNVVWDGTALEFEDDLSSNLDRVL